MTERIETSLEMTAYYICLITKQEGDEVRKEILMRSVTKPFHARNILLVPCLVNVQSPRRRDSARQLEVESGLC